ncbi:hypothetical protein AURDEDRAFT_111788 [Auricularia subglabra TFB-10046 SS5]|nr:hypothetical protein AURDEDRAFT_111788 [Auricularia subglabra TFB-10046 SS5]
MPQSRRYSAFEPQDLDSPSASLMSSYFDAADIGELPAIEAEDLIESSAIVVDGEESVENACKALLDNKTNCIVVRGPDGQYLGLFDYADVNAFLVLAVNSHNLRPFELADTRITEILACAKKGHVPVRLVVNLSEKNPLVLVPQNADLIALLRVFSRGTHQVVVEDEAHQLLGIVSDMRLVEWFMTNASTHHGLASVLIAPLTTLPGIYQHPVISCSSDDTLLDAMRLLSEQGVSSVAVVDPLGMLLSAISVRDIGRRVVPSSTKRILDMSLSAFITLIKAEDGATDGVDKYPVYSVLPSSTLSYTMQKLLATHAHRVFLTDDPACPPSPPVSLAGLANHHDGHLPGTPPSAGSLPMPLSALGNLRGVVSVLDVLSVFARLLGLEDVDPTRAGRHRRASSASARSGRSMSTQSSRSSMSLSLTSPPTSLDRAESLRKKHAVRLSLGSLVGSDTSGVQIAASISGGRVTGMTPLDPPSG